MPLKQILQLSAVAAFATWIVLGGQHAFKVEALDPIITGSVAERAPQPPPPPLPPGRVRVIIAQADVEDAPAPQDTQLTAPAAPPSRPVERLLQVDESALRYFARQGDTRRLNAEIARLRALYPAWQPPDDPTAPEVFTDTELDRMWALFSDGRYADVRSAIAARRADQPGWAPPEALASLLDQADARLRIVNASDSKQWNTVIDTAARTPSLLTCGYVDILWRVAEAFAETDRTGRAMDAYTYILTNCADPEERVATVQKALDLVPETEVQALLQFDRGDEFRPVRDDILRRRVGAIAESSEGSADPADITRLRQLAEDPQDASAPLILGWYHYRRADPGTALDYFRRANERDPASAKAAEGYALSLIGLDRFAEAEGFAYDWNEASGDNLAAYLIAVVDMLGVDPPLRISEAVLQRIVGVVRRERSPEGAEQLGWYAYNLGQVQTAARWFETSLSWSPDFEPGAYGLAVALIALKDRAGANAIIARWRERSERIAALGRPSRAELRGPSYTIDAAVFADPGEAPAPARAAPRTATGPPVPARQSGCADGGAPVASLSPDAALRRGWCLMDLNRPVEAAQAFERALHSPDEKTRSDAAYGASLANLRSGVTDKAAVAAAAAPLSPTHQVELTVSILTQQALAAYADGHYAQAILALDERNRHAQEEIDLLVLRGFAYLKLGRVRDAKRIFQAAAGTGHPDAVRGLAEVQAAQNGFYR